MELVYLYIKSYKNSNGDDGVSENFIIEDKGFNFSRDFECKYSNENGLEITKLKPKFKDFYGENIKSLNVIVGENGCGKTTILDIVGMMYNERANNTLRNHTEYVPEYFLLYYNGGKLKNFSKLKLRVAPEFKHSSEIRKKLKYTKNKILPKKFIYDEFFAEVATNMDFNYNKNCFFFENVDYEYCSLDGRNSKKLIGCTFRYNFENNKIESFDTPFFNEWIPKYKGEISKFIDITSISHSFSEKRNASHIEKGLLDKDLVFKRQNILLSSNSPSDYTKISDLLALYEYSDFNSKVLNSKFNLKIEDLFNERMESLDGYNGLKKFTGNIDLIKQRINKVVNVEIDNEKDSFLIRLSKRYINYLICNLYIEAFTGSEGDAFDHDDLKLNEFLALNRTGAYEFKFSGDGFNKVKSLNNKLKELTDKAGLRDRYFEIENLEEVIDLIEKNEETLKYVEANNRFPIKINRILSVFIIFIRYLQYRRYRYRLIDGIDGYINSDISFQVILNCLINIDEKHFKNKYIVVDFSKTIDYENIVNLFNAFQQLIYKGFTVDFNIWEKFKITLPYSSDGERVMIDIFSKLLHSIEREQNLLHILLLDEPDQRLHPEWSRQFIQLVCESVKKLSSAIEKRENRKISIQLIMTTHSPLLLSDIKSEDVILLKKDKSELCIDKNNINTFGANIHEILRNSFFLKTTVGEFATAKIKEINEVISLNEKEFMDIGIHQSVLEEYRNIINEIGEPIIRNSLLSKLNRCLKWNLQNSKHTQTDNKCIDELVQGYENLTSEEKRRFINVLLLKGSENND